MRGYRRAAVVRCTDGGSDLLDREGGRLAVRPVQVELDEVGPIVKLLLDCGWQIGTVLKFNRESRRQAAGPGEPGAGGADVRAVGRAGPALSQHEAQRALAARRIGTARRADVAGPADAGASHQCAV